MTAGMQQRRVLFFFNSLGYLRFFDSVIRSLLERGHEVHLLLERDDHEPNERAWLDEMSTRPGFSHGVTRSLSNDRFRGVGSKLRRSSDYLRFSGPEFRDAPHLVARTRGRAPASFLRLVALPFFRSEVGRRFLSRVVLLFEHSIPSSRILEEELRSLAPDVFVISPHLMPGARHSEYVKSARAVGIPTCICIASWDNLSSKQLLREIPDRVVVWNEIQREEAQRIHGVPPERIAVTGAQNFDQWFTWQPRPRAEFAERIGLDPGRRFVLYLAGSLFPGKVTEAEWVRDRWLPALRACPGLERVEVLIRPHPSRQPEWVAGRLEGIDGVSVWPLGGNEMPVDVESRADYYDSIFHSDVVVGLNTSAMIEAAIVDKPVLCVLVPEFKESQVGTFHFDYLLTVAGGLARVAESLEEHLGQLQDTVEHGDPGASERNRAFVSTFVRPHGLERDATTFVLEAIDDVASRPGRAHRRREWRFFPLRSLLLAYLYGKAVVWKLGRGRRPATSRSS